LEARNSERDNAFEAGDVTNFPALILAPLVAVIGWFVAHQFNVHRDRLNKRRDLRIQYLLEAYRRLESAANREEKTEEQAVDFESAVADIQLLGTSQEINATVKYLREHASGEAQINELLCLLRDDLRGELGLPLFRGNVVVFRFIRHWDSGNERGETIARTIPVQAQSLIKPQT